MLKKRNNPTLWRTVVLWYIMLGCLYARGSLLIFKMLQSEITLVKNEYPPVLIKQDFVNL